MSEKTICVYCSSSNGIAPVYFELARDLGRVIATAGWGLVYGGGSVGLMGALARSVQSHGGRVCGVIPEFMVHEGLGYDACDELIVTPNMRERKAIMEARADAFVALPGGFGTLEELLEIITLKLLSTHKKPIVMLNVEHFFDPLLALFEHLVANHFAEVSQRSLYCLVSDVPEALRYLERQIGFDTCRP